MVGPFQISASFLLFISVCIHRSLYSTSHFFLCPRSPFPSQVPPLHHFPCPVSVERVVSGTTTPCQGTAGTLSRDRYPCALPLTLSSTGSNMSRKEDELLKAATAGYSSGLLHPCIKRGGTRLRPR